ncbi:transcription initiation factor IIA subunit 1-like [Brassica rapa]|uniref:transcription initiation factor IIA subunit 1-like n=1 Tax=Brassica campestris TaxID=3711 RepID=UPI0008729581|nr:transcription initiation factor IIA subunit 1-like [Brassica rapa]
MDTSETTMACISISNDVISKMRSENWLRKMIEAGVISEAILPSSASFPFPSPAVIVPAPRQTQDTNPLPGDAATGVDIDAQLPSTDLVMSTKNDIPQNDGSGDGDDADIKPNTNAPYDEDDEDLNENDDVEEEGGTDDDHIPYLIICQFDNVKKKRGTNKWDCKFRAGVMQINTKKFFSLRLKEISTSNRSLI